MTYHVFCENGRWRIATAPEAAPADLFAQKFRSKREAVQVARLLAGWRGRVRIQNGSR